jgi:hypothetical protein
MVMVTPGLKANVDIPTGLIFVFWDIFNFEVEEQGGQ